MLRVILNISKRHHHVETVFNKESGVFAVPSFNKQLISCFCNLLLLYDGDCVLVVICFVATACVVL